MKVLLFGASGMVGQGVLRECLAEGDVTEIVSVVRRPTGKEAPKLREVVHGDFYDFTPLAADFRGVDACFFCLGVTSAGLSEAEYSRLTYDLTLAAANVLAKESPGATFIYVSGTGTDSTERGRTMWARVKGRTENALFALPLEARAFRPGLIQPLDGIRSRTRLYALAYAVMRPLMPLVRRLAPNAVVTTRVVGRAMLEVAKRPNDKRIYEPRDINEAGSTERATA